MKDKLDKSDLVEEVANMIYEDFMSGNKVDVEGLLFNLSEKDLIKYLPQNKSKDFEILLL